MRLSFIPFLFLVVPLTEIAVFVLVGGQIGVLATIGLVIATAVLGTILLRIQGFGVMERIRRSVDAGEVPGRELVHGVMILVAGVLLLTPGFVTDTLGFLLFVPAIRDRGWSFLRERIVVVAGSATTGPRHARPGGRSIDLDADEYTREDGSSGPDPRRPPLGRE